MSAGYGLRIADCGLRNSKCARPSLSSFISIGQRRNQPGSNLLCGVIIFFLALCGLQGGPSPEPDIISPTGPVAGRELAALLRSLRPAEDLKWHGTLKIFRRSQKNIPPVPIRCETAFGETTWSIKYFTGATKAIGAETLTIIYFTNAPNQYLYARAASPDGPLGEAKSLTAAEANIPLAGSDFLLSDLGYEFYHWPDQIRHPGEMKDSRPCYVLESINPHPAAGGYARVMTWVEKESNQPLLAQAYDADRSEIKRFELGAVEKVHGHYQVKELKMFNDKAHSRTELDFDFEGQ
jgi:Outer membrane lipoprotein-sorting protein